MSILALIGLVATGLLAGFAGGLFGIGGGLIIVPALYAAFTSLGVPEDTAIKSAVATSMATIIVTSIRSVMRHHRHDNVDFQVLRTWALAMGAGAVLGAFAARSIDGQTLTAIFAVGLIILAIQRYLTSGRKAAGPQGKMPGAVAQQTMAGAIGVISSLMGIGGGVMGVLLLTKTGHTVHRAVGTAAGFGLIIAVPGTLGFLWPSSGAEGNIPWQVGYVSALGFLAIALGTFIAAPIGASTASRLSPVLLTRIFSAYALITGVFMLKDAFWS